MKRLNSLIKNIKYENLIEYFSFIEKCRQDKNYYLYIEKTNSKILFYYVDILIHSHYSFKFQYNNYIEIYTVTNGDCKTKFNKKTKRNEILSGTVNVSVNLYTEYPQDKCINFEKKYLSFKDFTLYFINNNFEVIL